MKSARVFGVVLIVCLLAVAPSSSAKAGSDEWPKFVSIAAARVGTVNYTLSAGMAELISKYMKIKAVPEPSSVGGKTLHLLNDKKAEFVVSACDQAYDAARGIGAFKKYGKMNVRTLWMGSTTPFALITHKDQGITSVPQLKGKKVMATYPGNLSFGLVMDLFLKAEGMTRDDIVDVSFTGWREGATAVQEKRVAAFIHPFAAEGIASWIQQVNMEFPVRMFGISEDKIDKLLEEYSYIKKSKLRASDYGEILFDKDLITAGNVVSWFCHPDLSEDFVYEVMKTVFDHMEEIYSLHKFVKEYTEDPLARAQVPFHSGVVKYWKEKGQWTAAHDQMQQRLIKEVGN